MQRVRTCLRGGLWLLILVAVLECGARLDDLVSQGAPFCGLYDRSVLLQFDALGPTGKPNTRFGKWRINATGLRGPELSPERLHILTLGSSETYGMYERENGEWPQRLVAGLNRRQGAPRFDAANAANAGETFATTLKRLPTHLSRLHPVAVLIYPSFANYLLVPYLPAHPARPEPPPLFRWRIQGRIEQMLKQDLPDPLQDELRAWETRRAAAHYPVVWHTIPDSLREQFRTEIGAAVTLARGAGADVFLIAHTTRFGSHVTPAEQRWLANWRKFYPMLDESGFLPMEQSMNQVLREVAATHGATFVDAAAQMPAGPRYYFDFVHFTDEGAETFANIVAGAMEPWRGGLAR